MYKNLLTALYVATLMALLPSSLHSQVTMTLDASQRGSVISPYQYGLFYEEINHAGDGGLYAELVRNRSFEESDKPDGWHSVGSDVTLNISKDNLLNTAQHRALIVDVAKCGKGETAGIANEGYWGMAFRRDSTYTLTLFVKSVSGKAAQRLTARLMSADGTKCCGEAVLTGKVSNRHWTKLKASIKATANADAGQLHIVTSAVGKMAVDVVSLFPYTWKGRKNGLRPDLAQLLADTHPTFLRFPGGCYVEGRGGFETAFQWKKTLGPIEQRPGHKNTNWGYFSSDGLGFDEYLQLSNDIGAAPMFVVNVGLGHEYNIPLADVDTLVQNTLDAIEYANGDASTKWGALRIANGHESPYGLKFIEIGNENYQTGGPESEQYVERYSKFYNAIKKKYPDIICIGNVEAWGTDSPSWRNSNPVDLVDEHYYKSFGWMLDNYSKYDNYPRNPKVYVGEYAANAGGTYGRYGTISSALGEAVFMLGMERNSDVCQMASFAPIFMNEKDATWAYDMIHYNASSVFCTPSYYVQKLMGWNASGQNLAFKESGNMELKHHEPVTSGVGTWLTGSTFRDFKVTDDATGTVVRSSKGWNNLRGTWSEGNGTLTQSMIKEECLSLFGDFVTSGNYTISLKARKDSGSEGFLIIFDYADKDNYSWWNIGGWGNTRNAIEVCRGGAKGNVSESEGNIKTGVWYDLCVKVTSDTVKCYINDRLINSYVKQPRRLIYQSAQIDDATKQVVLKVANPHSYDVNLKLDIKNMRLGDGKLIRLSSPDGNDENTMEQPDRVIPVEMRCPSACSDLSLPPHSLSVYRWNIK